MKTSTVGLVLAAILMVLAGVGFGIAQAGGNQSYDPILKFGDQDVNPYIGWQAREALEAVGLFADSDSDSPKVATGEALEQDTSSSLYTEDRPVLSFADEMQLRNPSETGSLSDASNADSSIVEIEQDKYREGGDIGP